MNRDKYEFNKDRLTFLGHVIDKHGVSPDPEKNLCNCSNAKTNHTCQQFMRRFMGANQLGKFTPMIAEISQPLRELLKELLSS